MARRFSAGPSLSHAAAVVTAAPFTMSIWTRPATVGPALDQYIASIGVSGSATNYWALYRDDSTGRPRFGFANATVTQAEHATPVVAGQWSHFCGIEASATSHSIVHNGLNKVTVTTSKAPAGVNLTEIGAGRNADMEAYVGDLADFAVWNVALTDFEVLLLARGAPPFMIQPNKLVCYVPLGRSNTEAALVSGRLFVPTGAIGFAPRPPQLWTPNSLNQRWGNTYVPSAAPWAKRRPASRQFGSVAASGFQPAWAARSTITIGAGGTL